MSALKLPLNLSALKQFEPLIKGKSADVNALKLSLKLLLVKGKSADVAPPRIDTAPLNSLSNLILSALKLLLIKGKPAGVTLPHIDTAREHFDLM